MPDIEPAGNVPFTDFARYYDRFMNHYVDYRSWVDYVARIFGKFKVEPKTVLDLACGTGIPTVLMARRGYEMFGVDRAPAMLDVLRSKTADLPIRTVEADMTDFTLPGPVDATISLYDSINYLLREEQLLACFKCVRRALRPGGLFVFDVNTIYSLAVFWGERLTPRDAGGIRSIWENSYDPATNTSTLNLTFWEPAEAGSNPVRYHETHHERAYSRHELKRNLKAAGFGRVQFYTHGGFLPVGPLTVRMMVVAR